MLNMTLPQYLCMYTKKLFKLYSIAWKTLQFKKKFDQYITQRRQSVQQIKHQVYLKILDMLCEDIHHRIVNCIIIEKKNTIFYTKLFFWKRSISSKNGQDHQAILKLFTLPNSSIHLKKIHFCFLAAWYSHFLFVYTYICIYRMIRSLCSPVDSDYHQMFSNLHETLKLVGQQL